MKISRIETHLGSHQAVVRVSTDDGAEGTGQTAPRPGTASPNGESRPEADEQAVEMTST